MRLSCTKHLSQNEKQAGGPVGPEMDRILSETGGMSGRRDPEDSIHIGSRFPLIRAESGKVW